jgi:hypothetical protein
MAAQPGIAADGHGAMLMSRRQHEHVNAIHAASSFSSFPWFFSLANSGH